MLLKIEENFSQVVKKKEKSLYLVDVIIYAC